MRQKATKLDVEYQNCFGKEEHQQEQINFGWKCANDVISHFRRIYFKTLDCIINAIEDRFDQEDFRKYVNFENLLLKAAKRDIFIQEYNDVTHTSVP